MSAVAGPGAEPAVRRVFVTVGSDHHRFDRLVGWVDRWATARGLGPGDVLIQHGPADAPQTAAGVDFVGHDALLALMKGADVVVCQGGPMSIVEAREQGRRPVAVPRTAALDEVVDDHQHAFCLRMSQAGLIDLATTEDEFVAALDAALADPAGHVVGPDPVRDATIAANIGRFARVADGVLGTRSAIGRPRPTVLLFGGFGRSGSTLLERALATAPGVTALGEVLHLWDRGLVGDELCGCGRPFRGCPFWSEVGEVAFGGWDAVDATTAQADRADVVRNRRLGGLVTGLLPVARRLRRDRLVRRLDALYAAAAQVAGSRVLVDSSKHPAYAYVLRRARVDLRCVLVVRDPRGVAYSWQKSVRRPEVADRDELMPRYAPGVTAVKWSAYGALFSALRAVGIPVLTVRYEDLMADAPREVGRVLAFAGMAPDAEALAAVRRTAVEFGTDHTVAGNPMRFTTGSLPLRSDEQWRTDMPGLDRRLVSVISAPARLLYGYRGRARG